jgi:hypothetical protein
LLWWSTLKISYKFVRLGMLEGDTCWILALGRYIWQFKHLPVSDPFSFTLPLAAAVGLPEPFVVHQWLFDLVIYLIYAKANLVGLCTFGAVLAVIAFVCLPWRMLLRANAPPVVVYLVTLFSAVSVEIRPFLRPEIASCVCFAVWLALLQKLRIDAEAARLVDSAANQNVDQKQRFDWKFAASFFAVMVVWCNVHTGFVSGLVMLAIFAASFALQDLVDKKKESEAGTSRFFSFATIRAVQCLLVSAVAVLFNPRGFDLVKYLPHMFGVSQYIDINEMEPLLVTSRAADPNLLPFYLLGLIAVFAVGYYLKPGSKHPLKLYSPIRLASVLLIIGAIYSTFKISRMVSFSVLILALEIATLFGRSRIVHGRPYWGLSPVSVLCRAKKISPKFRHLNKLWEIFLIVNTILAVSFYDYWFPVVALPLPSRDFNPPMKAIEWLKTHPQSGPLFNYDLIGDMLIWYMPNVKVFIDSRFDEYGEHILRDYVNVINLQRGALNVLNVYGVEWIFVPTNAPFCTVLKKIPAWTPIYSDKDATIFRRKPAI